MAKKIKYKKNGNYFKSNSKNIDYDEKYDTPELELEWDSLVIANQAEDALAEEEMNNRISPTKEEIIRAVVLQMIAEGIVKEGQDYEPPK